MTFFEFEKLMKNQGFSSLAEIARALNTTPQAVNNWKSRNQVPHHIVAKLNENKNNFDFEKLESIDKTKIIKDDLVVPKKIIPESSDKNLIDVLVAISEQIKLIFLITFLSTFMTFTYVKFLKKPLYISQATVLLPTNNVNNLGGFAGLASQFGVNIPTESTADLSSPTLYPDLLKSRTFAEKILDKEFYTQIFSKKLSLLEILTHGDSPTNLDRNSLVSLATEKLNSKYLTYIKEPKSNFSIIRVTAEDPIFAKNLAEVVLSELDSLNRFFKSKTVNEKTSFIQNRIKSVESELKLSELALKSFNEKNRQISSPALRLESERLERNAEVQKGIYLTLKQQLELAKIEEVQKISVIQILDRPQISLAPSNKNIPLSIVVSFIIGVGLGISFGIIRSNIINNSLEERKKQRRIKFFLKKKIKDLFKDFRVAGTVSLIMLLGMPFFLSATSPNPTFFGVYSTSQLISNMIYILIFLSSTRNFFKNLSG